MQSLHTHFNLFLTNFIVKSALNMIWGMLAFAKGICVRSSFSPFVTPVAVPSVAGPSGYAVVYAVHNSSAQETQAWTFCA